MVFNKRLSELSKIDINILIDEALPEGAEIEYKKSLPAKNGDDLWITEGKNIGDKARNEILEEVIAFANAYGGILILGIQETRGKPPSAEKITPIPKCIELAERLRLQCRDCIDPQIPLIELVGVSIEDDGSGVVVIQVPQSRLAPHRHQITKECYVRRADRSEKMTMREIQDLTLQVERGITQINKTFSANQEKCHEEFSDFSRNHLNAYMMRATLVPMIPLKFDRIHENHSLCAFPRKIKMRVDDSDNETDEFNLTSFMLFQRGMHYFEEWRPILRGARGIIKDSSSTLQQEISCEGTISFKFFNAYNNPRVITPVFVLHMIGNALILAEKFRRISNTTAVEYGLEFEIFTEKEPISIVGYSSYFNRREGLFPHGSTLFPRYSIGASSEFSKLLTLIVEDFWNAAGFTYKHKIAADFSCFFNI